MLINKEDRTVIRLSDFWGIIPSITGKVELVYEGEQEGPYAVALSLMGAAFKEEFMTKFPHPDKFLKETDVDIFEDVKNWFTEGHSVELMQEEPDSAYQAKLKKIPGLTSLARKLSRSEEDRWIAHELILHALAEFNVITKEVVDSKTTFRDMLANMLDDLDD